MRPAKLVVLGHPPDLLSTRGPHFRLHSDRRRPCYIWMSYLHSILFYIPTPPCLHPSSWFIIFQTSLFPGILHNSVYVFPDFDLNTTYILFASISS